MTGTVTMTGTLGMNGTVPMTEPGPGVVSR